MKPHLLAIALIERIAQGTHENAKSARESLVDLLDTTRNQNRQPLNIVVISHSVTDDELHVQVQFANYDVYSLYTITVPVLDFLVHKNYNGDATLINNEPEHIDVKETILGAHRVDVSLYIDDICNGRIGYKFISYVSC